MKLSMYLLLLFLVAGPAFGQDSQKAVDNHDHRHPFEIEFGAGAAWSLSEKEIAPVFHLHVHKDLWHHIGLGFGYEVILDEHLHQAIHPSIHIHFLEKIHFSIGPGLLIIRDEPVAFSTHFELGLGFPVGRIKLGPFAEYAWSRNDQHISAGLRIGF